MKQMKTKTFHNHISLSNYKPIFQSALKQNSTKLTIQQRYTFQDPQWMPETADNTEPAIYCFFPTHTYVWQSYFIN